MGWRGGGACFPLVPLLSVHVDWTVGPSDSTGALPVPGVDAVLALRTGQDVPFAAGSHKFVGGDVSMSSTSWAMDSGEPDLRGGVGEVFGPVNGKILHLKLAISPLYSSLDL